MRVAAALVLLLALAACNREKSFDERYGDAEKSIRATAAAIDKDLADQEKAQQDAEKFFGAPTAAASGAAAAASGAP